MEWRKGLKESLQRVQEIYEFIAEHRAICEVHSVGYFTEDHWSNVVPRGWRKDLLDTEDLQNPIQLHDGELKMFLERAKSLKLGTTDVSHLDSTHNPNNIDHFGMSSKKAHEVKKMADCVKSVTEPSGVKQIIDIGSGKGYLSQCLAFTHNFTVVGIDSESINTRAAIDRCMKVEKYFKKDHLRKTPKPSPPTSSTSGDSSELFEDVSETLQSLFGDDDDGINKESLPATASLSEPVDYYKVETSTRTQRRQEQRPRTHPLMSSYYPITHRITPSDNIMQLVADNARGHLNPREPMALVGLHTCGDLGPNLLRQFTATPHLTALCVVCCCYHHISVGGAMSDEEQRYDEEKISIDNSRADSEDVPGFPMSSYLKSLGAHIGRNTRMLAGQSEGRFYNICFGKALQSVFYRALLHVVLENEMKLIKNLVETLVVGAIKIFDGFVDYSRKAFDKLKIPQDQQPSDETLNIYHEQYLPRLVELQRLVQLRAILAPVVESFIILDRLVYLLEVQVILLQNGSFGGRGRYQGDCGIKDAWIVQLFSPEISPRCFALCAVK